MSSWVYRKQVGSDAHLVAWMEVRLYVAGAVELEGGGWSRGIESRPVPRSEVAEVDESLEYIENRVNFVVVNGIVTAVHRG